MIIPRHKVCDFCKTPVGVNKRYFKIKSKNYLVGYAGSCTDNRTHHICEDCIHRIISVVEGMKDDEKIALLVDRGVISREEAILILSNNIKGDKE